MARLRPILMTSFAFIAGLIPLMMASGAGALGNRSIGTAAVGGMLIGTILGVIVIPGLVILFSKKDNKKQIVKQASLVIAALILFGSCSVPKKAVQPEKITVPAAFSASALKDSINVGNRSWKEIFKDPLLVALIDSALQNNMDIRQSILRLESAQAYFKQRKAALGPTLEAAVEGDPMQLSAV